MAVDFRLAEPSDAAWFAARLRPADAAELTAASGPDLENTLALAIETSHGRAFVASGDEGPFALFGFAPLGLLADMASPWMVGTDTLFRHGRTLNRFGRAYCAAALQEFRALVNFVDVRNTVSIAWLKHLGFVFSEPLAFGVEGRPFMRFEMRADRV